MTDQEVFERFINKYGHKYPEFNKGNNYWNDFNNGLAWYKEHITSGPYSEIMERYHRAILEVVCIEEQMKRGGFDGNIH